MTPFRAHSPLFLAACTLLFAGIAFAQDNPDRPPWAQKPKSTSASTSNTAPAPASSPTGEPGKIVQPTPPASTNDSQDAAAQRARIRVNVNLVNVLVSVLYVDLALMIDSSLSAHKEITFEQEAAAHFIRQVLRTGDRLAVFSFDENVTQVAAFSDNVPALQTAVRRIPPGAGTSIYDAVLLGSRALQGRGDDRRRVIILVTDAGETTSRADFDAARKEAVRSNSLLYTIVVRPVKNESGRNTAGEHALETMTDTTGGAMFYPDSAQDLGVIFDRIDRELRTQYRLGYYPNPRGPANSYRSIEVKVIAGDYKVRHRRSYLTGPQ